MDKSEVRSPDQGGAVSADKAFSESVGNPGTQAQPPTDVVAPPDNQQLADQPAAAEAPKNPAPKTRAPIGAIILAVIVAGGLAVLTVYAYRQTNQPVTEDIPTETTQAVEGSEVDSTSAEIEQSISELDDAEDFTESELSDSSLGL